MVGPGNGQQAGDICCAADGRLVGAAEPTAPEPGRPLHRGRRGIGADMAQAGKDIPLPAAADPFIKQGDQVGTERGAALILRLQKQAGVARMGRQTGHFPANRRQLVLCIEGAELAQKIAGGSQVSGRRRVNPGQPVDIGNTPAGQVERQRRQIDNLDLRRRLRQQRPVRSLAPEPVAGSGTEATGPAGALPGA